MHNDSLKRLTIFQKLISDPQKIPFRLILERNARLHARMDEQVIPDPRAQMKGLEKLQMGGRSESRQLLARPLPLLRTGPVARGTYAVRDQCLHPSELGPSGSNPGILKKLQHRRLMVSFKEVRLKPRHVSRDEHIQDISRLKSPVDIVSQKNEDRFSGEAALADILIDDLEQAEQKVGPSMDIAHRVNPPPVGNRRRTTGRPDRTTLRHGPRHTSGKVIHPRSEILQEGPDGVGGRFPKTRQTDGHPITL